MEIITAGIPEKDSCPVLTRIKAFIVDQGVLCALEHTVRDRRGKVVDLSKYFASNVSESSSSSEAGETGTVELRVKDWLGTGWSDERNPVWQIIGEPADPEKGTIRATLEDSLVAKPGIYELSWGIRNAAGSLVMTNQGILSVEKTLFGSLQDIKTNDGPPTINEIRMWMMDSAASENSLLDDVEFGDEQIMLALTAPIRQWNETPPPIETLPPGTSRSVGPGRRVPWPSSTRWPLPTTGGTSSRRPAAACRWPTRRRRRTTWARRCGSRTSTTLGSSTRRSRST